MLLFTRPVLKVRQDPAVTANLSPSMRRMMRTLADTRQEQIRQFTRRQSDVIDALIHGPSTRLTALIPLDPWWDVQDEIRAELQAELLDAGRRVRLPNMEKAVLRYKFDDTRPEAAAWATKEAGTLIQGVTEEQLAYVRTVISAAQMGEVTPVGAARLFRQMQDGMGLTTQQSGWVENFRRRMIDADLAAGRSFEEAERRSQKPTARYADRIYKYRTETIARTEIMRSSNAGRNQAWAQGVEQGFISPDSLKIWSTTPDARTCDICGPLNDETVKLNEEFPRGDPPVHPNCRCTVTLTDEIPPDLAAMTDDELEAEIDRLLSGDVPQVEVPVEAVPGLRTLDDAVAQARTDNEGSVFAWDADLIEDLEVKLRSTSVNTGQGPVAVTEIRFKARGRQRITDAAERISNLTDPVTEMGVIPKEDGGVVDLTFEFANQTEMSFKNSRSVWGKGDDGTTYMITDSAGDEKSFSLDGQVRVFVPANIEITPDVMRRVMTTVGLDEADAPPTPQAVRTLKENKVLALMDGLGETQPRAQRIARVERQMGVKIDDLIVESGSHGRINVLLPEKAVKKIRKETGVRYFNHRTSMSKSHLMDIVDPNTPDRLKSTIARFSDGKPVRGLSSLSDVSYGGADYVFVRPMSSVADDVGGTAIYYKSEPLLARTDWYAYTDDNFGIRNPQKAIWPQTESQRINYRDTLKLSNDRPSAETMFKNEIDSAHIDFVMMEPDARDAMIDLAEGRGLTEINGRKLDDFFRVHKALDPTGMTDAESDAAIDAAMAEMGIT